jgi:hypothetical protein
MLKPGGLFLFDICQEAAFEKKQEACTFEHQKSGGFWAPMNILFTECP